MRRTVKDRETNASKGYAFCEYTKQEHALCAINSIDQLEVFGRRLKVDSAQKGKDMEYGGARLGLETKKEIEKALKRLTIAELYDVVSEMKLLIQRDKEHATSLLESKPVLAQALLTAQLMLGMAQISAEPPPAPGSNQPPQLNEAEVEQQALINQIMSLTPEQIEALAPEEKEQVLAYRRHLGVV